MGKTVLRMPQDWLRFGLLFWFGPCLRVYWDVGTEFFFI